MNIIFGKSEVELDKLEPNSIGACITDAPYGLTSIIKRFSKENSASNKEGVYKRLSKGFMGQTWDGSGIERDPIFWAKVLRILKPGGYLICIGHPRTHHRTVCAIEDAGFEIRDEIAWVYGQGYPKNLDIGKQVRKISRDIRVANDWDGWGTALKPAMEPICIARKLLSEGSVASNIIEWGTGGMNIDESRVPSDPYSINKLEVWSGFGEEKNPDYIQEINIKGRWPANIIHDGSEEVKAYMGEAAGFFFCAKPTQDEKNRGVKDFKKHTKYRNQKGGVFQDIEKEIGNIHPTVKPRSLMRYLIGLVTKPGDVVLDPFMGSGTTMCAAKEMGREGIGIEYIKEYYDIAIHQINATQQGFGMQ